MKYRNLFSIAVLFVTLAACQSAGIPPPETPAQTVFVAKGQFLIALGVANNYRALPPCPTVIVCSSPSVVAILQKTANATDVALDAAETTVNDPAFKDGPAAVRAALLATSAISALQAITAGLRVR